DATLHSRTEGLQHVMLFGVHREQNRFGARRDFTNLTDRNDAVHDRHRQIEHGDVGLVLLRETDRLDSIDCFANDLEVLALEKNSDALAYNGMIVSKNDCRWHAQMSSGISILRSVPRSPLRPRRTAPPRAPTRALISVRPSP